MRRRTMTSRAIGVAAAVIGLVLASGIGTARAGGPSWDESTRAERREARWRKNPAAAIPEMVKEICRGGESDGTANELLLELGARAVAPLLAALQPDGSCRGEPAMMVAEIVCEAQSGTDAKRVSGAFAPVRAALGSPYWKRVEAALSVIELIGDPPPDTPTPGSLATRQRGNAFECVAPTPLLDASAAPLGRLLEATTGPRRERVAAVVSSLGTQAAPLVPVLARVLDDDDARFEAVTALGAIGPAAASAAPALGKLLAHSEDPEQGLRVARALATMGPRAAAALPALRARLTQASANPCARGQELPWLIFAVLNLGPGPGSRSKSGRRRWPPISAEKSAPCAAATPQRRRRS